MRIQQKISMISLLLLSMSNLAAQTIFQPFPALKNAIHLEDVTIDPPYSTSIAYEMALHADGTRYIVGQVRGDVDFDPGPGELIYSDDWGDPYIAIYPPNGDPIVHQFFNDQGGTGAEMTQVQIDDAGNAYVLGEFDADLLVVGDGLADLVGTFDTPFLAKINPMGVVQWAFSLPDSPSSPEINAMTVNENRIVIGGKLSSAGADFDPDPVQVAFAAGGAAGGRDPFIASYSLAGDFIWVRVMEQLVVGQSNDGVEDLLLIDNDQLLVAGAFNSNTDFDASAGSLILSSEHTDAFIAHYDGDGFPVWAKQMGGVGNARAFALSIATDGSMITVAGNIIGEIDFDPDPMGTELISSVPANSNDYYIAGYTNTGELQWVNLIDGSGTFTWGSLSTSAAGISVLGGTGADFGGGQIDFDPGPLNSGNTPGGFLALYAADGSYIDAHSFDDVPNVYISDVLWDGVSTIHASGRFLEIFDVDPSANTTTLNPTTPFGHEIFFAAWSDVVFKNGFE